MERDIRDWTIGRVGGFDLVCSVRRVLIGHGCAAELVLLRTEHEQKIEVGDDLTALGLISRIEYALNRFEIDLEEQTRRWTDAIARLKGYQPRLGEPFPLQGELDEKLARMVQLHADLAQTKGVNESDGQSPPGVTAEAA